MMTIDDAIHHCEEVAEGLEKEAVRGCCDDTEIMNNCYECAKEHRQLAEWLRELKAFRSGIYCSTCKYREVDNIDYPCMYCNTSDSKYEYGGAE